MRSILAQSITRIHLLPDVGSGTVGFASDYPGSEETNNIWQITLDLTTKTSPEYNESERKNGSENGR